MREPKILWQYKISRWDAGPTPALGGDGSVYFAPCQDTHVYALNAHGKELWRYCYEVDFDSECERSGGAEISVSPNGQVVVVRHGQGPQGDKDGSFTELLVLEKTGKLAWKHFWKGEGPLRSAAIGPDGAIYFSSPSKKLCAFQPGGKLKWEFKAGGKLCTTPRIGVDGSLFVGATDKKIYSVKPDGTEKWSFFAGGLDLREFSLGAARDVILNTYDGEYIALNETGHKRMGIKLPGWGWHTAPLVFSDGAGVACIGDQLLAVAADGHIIWKHSFKPGASPSPQVLAADGSVLVQPRVQTGPGTCEGNIIAIGSDGSKLWEVALGEHATHGLTLTTDGVLYLLTSRALYAIQCPSGLADAPWPMDVQNSQRTSCADPKFSQFWPMGGQL